MSLHDQFLKGQLSRLAGREIKLGEPMPETGKLVILACMDQPDGKEICAEIDGNANPSIAKWLQERFSQPEADVRVVVVHIDPIASMRAFFEKCDRVPEVELIELVEVELRELFGTFNGQGGKDGTSVSPHQSFTHAKFRAPKVLGRPAQGHRQVFGRRGTYG